MITTKFTLVLRSDPSSVRLGGLRRLEAPLRRVVKDMKDGDGRAWYSCLFLVFFVFLVPFVVRKPFHGTWGSSWSERLLNRTHGGQVDDGFIVTVDLHKFVYLVIEEPADVSRVSHLRVHVHPLSARIASQPQCTGGDAIFYLPGRRIASPWMQDNRPNTLNVSGTCRAMGTQPSAGTHASSVKGTRRQVRHES